MILIINSGSSSIKMALISASTRQSLAEGMAERLGSCDAVLHWRINDSSYASAIHTLNNQPANHQTAVSAMLELLFKHVSVQSVTGVGHRVVHGGERFVEPVLLTDAVVDEIESLSHLAPLHNPANITGIRAALLQMPSVPHVAVFDTAFHHAMPKYASLYAVPYYWYTDYGVRRYGFHGTSHHYVGLEAAIRLQRPFNDCQLLTAHLGNGCSATAIKDGLSVDTSMGMTPLAGLVMGTRSGDVDPGLHAYIARESGATLSEITDVLNRQSGLLGLSGSSNDMRNLLDAEQAGDDRAALAVDMFCYRLAKELCGLTSALTRIDAIVFTGGIGEHAAAIRGRTTALLSVLGVTLDAQRNTEDGRVTNGLISPDGAAVPVLVIATNEEGMIADHVSETLNMQGEQL